MNIFISNNNVPGANTINLGNHLYPILVGLTFYEKIIEQHKFEDINIYFCNECEEKYNFKQKISIYIISKFPLLKKRINFVSYNNFSQLLSSSNYIEYTKLNIDDISIEKDIYIYGYCQSAKYIDFDRIRYYFLNSPVYDYINVLYGDNINEYVSIHIRRGDYLKDGNLEIYFTLSKEYIVDVIDKFFKNDKFVIISDDIQWCKDNLSDITTNDVKFIDVKNPNYMPEFYMLIDLCIPIITKGNIVSPSSFCMFGASINPNKNIIINDPYYKKKELNEDEKLKIVPSWAKKHTILTYN